MPPITIQCQACTQTTSAPADWGLYEGPWRCPSCHAKHSIKCRVGCIVSLHLDDRFAPGLITSSQGVSSDVMEAVAAYNAYAPRAAVVMIRRALERACQEKGDRGDKLWQKIKDLHERVGMFDDAHVSLATATRHFGNYGAHPNDDLLNDLIDDEARRALDLGVYLISKMYT